MHYIQDINRPNLYLRDVSGLLSRNFMLILTLPLPISRIVIKFTIIRITLKYTIALHDKK